MNFGDGNREHGAESCKDIDLKCGVLTICNLECMQDLENAVRKVFIRNWIENANRKTCSGGKYELRSNCVTE